MFAIWVMIEKENNMKKQIIVALPALLIISACATDVYTSVYMKSGNNNFVGETSEAFQDSGDFVISAPNGTTCEGVFEYTKTLTGEGTITCSDKQSGNFVFTSKQDETTGQIKSMKGYGKFKNGEDFVITFGRELREPVFNLRGNENSIPDDLASQPSGRRGNASPSQQQNIYTGEPVGYTGQINIGI